MPQRARLAPEDQMTIAEFLAFTASRPDGERWELIEGVATLNPSPVDYHQIIVANLIALLIDAKRRSRAPWFVLPGTGTRVPVSVNSLPQPDVLVKEFAASGAAISDEGLVIIEVLSRANTKKDQAWRRRVYASVPNCQHYVTVATKLIDVTAYDRASGWEARRLTSLEATLDLPALGCGLPLAEIYRWTPLGRPE